MTNFKFEWPQSVPVYRHTIFAFLVLAPPILFILFNNSPAASGAPYLPFQSGVLMVFAMNVLVITGFVAYRIYKHPETIAKGGLYYLYALSIGVTLVMLAIPLDNYLEAKVLNQQHSRVATEPNQ